MSGIAWLQLAVVALSVAVITLGAIVTMVRSQVNRLEGHLITLLTALLTEAEKIVEERGEPHE